MSGILGGSADGIQNPVTPEQMAEAHKAAQTGLAQQQSFMNALSAQHGIQNQSDMYNQFGQVAAGQGPNPAQAQLANTTGANVANQAALMAGQRGAAQNVGMMAREAGMQGGALQQQAAGQSAALQAQQSLNAMGQQANIAGQQVGNQAQATQGYMNGALNQQGSMMGAMNAGNETQLKNQQMANSGKQMLINGIMQAGSAAATGGASMAAPKSTPSSGGNETVQASPQMFDTVHATPQQSSNIRYSAQGGEIKPSIVERLKMAAGGKVPVMVSPGEAYVAPGSVKAVAKGADPRKVGSVIPGTAKVKGDSKKNDTVPSMLAPGGVVIPRTVMNAKDHEAAASKFVQAVLSKKGSLRGKK